MLNDLSKYPINLLSNFLKSDVYVVFGSSYIKGDLADFLVKNKEKLTFCFVGRLTYAKGFDIILDLIK